MTHDEAVSRLTDFAEGRIDDARLRHAIAAHVVDCEECQGVLAMAEELEDFATGPGSDAFHTEASPSKPALARRWPATVAASLLVGVIGAGWGLVERQRALQSGAPAHVTLFPAETPVTRGGETPIVEVMVRESDGWAPVVVGFSAGQPIAGARIEVARADGAVAWSAAVGPLTPDSGVVWISARIPVRDLAPGTYSLSVRDAGGKVLTERPFRLLRLP